MPRPATLATLACIALSATARAEIIPGFELDSCAWTATHVAVVDNKGKVLESWAGDLKPGDDLPVGDFRLPAGQMLERPQASGRPSVKEKVSNNRVVLFLVKGDGKTGWRSANKYGTGTYDISAAWVHGGKVYALQQVWNPGPLRLVPVAKSEAEFKKQVTAVLDHKAQLRAALAEPDLGKRAAQLSHFTTSRWDLGWQEALAGLAKCGETGAKALAAILTRTGEPEEKLDAVRGLTRIGRPARGELIELLRTELGFWRAVAPDLPADWLHADPIVKDHLARLQAALASHWPYEGLSAGERRVIEETRDLWTENPVLRVKPRPGGHPAILADRILKGLNR